MLSLSARLPTLTPQFFALLFSQRHPLQLKYRPEEAPAILSENQPLRRFRNIRTQYFPQLGSKAAPVRVAAIKHTLSPKLADGHFGEACGGIGTAQLGRHILAIAELLTLLVSPGGTRVPNTDTAVAAQRLAGHSTGWSRF